MNSKRFSEAMGELDSRYVVEAVNYKRRHKGALWIKLGLAAACLAAVIAIGGILAPFHGGMVVSAYARDTDEEITAAGAVINSGTISDSGKMKGKPMMFYLSGRDIVSVRFSCKNQQISFMDWTEKREEYGNAQNFTVAYGEDESEYYYLTIDWVPNATIRELTDNADSTVAALPEEMRHDIIVMEILFENGKTATKAITISLLDNGTFFATFDDYEISDADAFVNRPDNEAIPRETFNDNTSDKPNGSSGEEGMQPDPSYETEADGKTDGAHAETPDPAVEKIAREYYSETVFEVVSMELKSYSPEEVIYSVCVRRGGIVQEPNRSITLQLHDGIWEVINEGY